MRTSVVFASVAVLSLSGVLACSSESSSSPGSSGGSSSSSSSGSSATVTSQQCSSRCQTKMTSCDAPADVVSQGCGNLCGNTLTEAQLSCFEGKSCQTIADAKSFDELCPAGSSSSSSSTSSSSSSSGGTSLPTKLTVSGTFPATKAIHVKSQDSTTIASSFSVSATPSFSPSQPSELPDVTKASSITVKSPNKGSCNAKITFTLNGSQAAVTIIGSDTLPATDCATFTDAVANQGILADLADVPYPNSSTKATVTFDLEP